MLLIGVKGNAGMSPGRNFGRGVGGGGQAKKGPHKNKTLTWRKKRAERPSKGGKKPPPTRKTEQKGLHIEKKVAEMPLNGEKDLPKREKRSKRAFK